MPEDLDRAERRRAFGRALSTARASKAFAQAELAEALGVSQSNVSAWEAGRWAPDAAQARALEAALDLSPGYLSAHLGFMPLDAATVSSCTVERAVAEDGLLDDVDRRALLGLYRELAGRPKR